MIGKTLRNYRITDKLGVGGQGAVYKATDLKLGRAVVIKVIPPEPSAKEVNLKRCSRPLWTTQTSAPSTISTKSTALISSRCSSWKVRTCDNSWPAARS